MITFINDTLIRLIEVTMTSRYLNNLIDLLITIWRVKPEYLETAINSTVPTYGDDAGIWTRETMVRGKCSYHCTTPALHPCSLNWCITNKSAFIKRLLNKKGFGYISLALVCMIKYTLITWFSFLLKKCLYEVNQPQRSEIFFRATKRSRQTGQPAFSYKHNNNFIRKQSMTRGSPVNLAGSSHLPFLFQVWRKCKDWWQNDLRIF